MTVTVAVAVAVIVEVRVMSGWVMGVSSGGMKGSVKSSAIVLLLVMRRDVSVMAYDISRNTMRASLQQFISGREVRCGKIQMPKAV